MLLTVVVVVNCDMQNSSGLNPLMSHNICPSLLFLLSYSIHLSNTYQMILIIILICCKLFLFDMSFRPMKLVVAPRQNWRDLNDASITFRMQAWQSRHLFQTDTRVLPSGLESNTKVQHIFMTYGMWLSQLQRSLSMLAMKQVVKLSKVG